MFVPEPATTPEQVKGRQIVICLCRKVYSFDAVHAVDLDKPIGEAVVRSVSASRPVPQPPEEVPPVPQPPEGVPKVEWRFVNAVTDQRFPGLRAAARHYYGGLDPPEGKK